ncbi:MAG: hypothetical protein K0S36_2484 [Nitrosospira multiformis]|jgi:hypothetical protein|nr:hypothetical protein [Nitrosospira multiformis]
MKKRFTDEQIIGCLKQVDEDIPVRELDVNMAFLMPSSTPRAPSLADAGI